MHRRSILYTRSTVFFSSFSSHVTTTKRGGSKGCRSPACVCYWLNTSFAEDEGMDKFFDFWGEFLGEPKPAPNHIWNTDKSGELEQGAVKQQLLCDGLRARSCFFSSSA